MTTDQVLVTMATENPKWADPESADGQCYLASVRLAMAFEEIGASGVWLIEAHHPKLGDHWAVARNALVYDLTARQFEPDHPFPWVCTEDEWRAWLVGWLGENTRFRKETLHGVGTR